MIITINGRLPALNEYTAACRGNRYGAAHLKKTAELLVAHAIHKANPEPIHGEVKIEFRWYEKDARRDLDNVAFAKKFILDALVAHGVIDGDGQRYVKGFSDSFYIDRDDPRIEVEINEA